MKLTGNKGAMEASGRKKYKARQRGGKHQMNQSFGMTHCMWSAARRRHCRLAQTACSCLKGRAAHPQTGSAKRGFMQTEEGIGRWSGLDGNQQDTQCSATKSPALVRGSQMLLPIGRHAARAGRAGHPTRAAAATTNKLPTSQQTSNRTHLGHHRLQDAEARCLARHLGKRLVAGGLQWIAMNDSGSGK